jgi:hypothetical protein
MDLECTGRKVGDIRTLSNEVAAWTKRRNDNKKKINWKFTKKNADEKLTKHYLSYLNWQNSSNKCNDKMQNFIEVRVLIPKIDTFLITPEKNQQNFIK